MSEIFNNDAAETKEVYEAAFDEYARQAKEHARELRAALFGIGEARSTALAQAIDADEDQLMRMDELSEFTGVETIGKAAFAAAVTRGDAPRVVHGYLEKFPENEPLLRAYEQAPAEEWIATQKENIAGIIKPPTEDRLRSRPSVRP